MQKTAIRIPIKCIWQTDEIRLVDIFTFFTTFSLIEVDRFYYIYVSSSLSGEVHNKHLHEKTSITTLTLTYKKLTNFSLDTSVQV